MEKAKTFMLFILLPYLHDELWPHNRHGGDTGTGLCRAVGGAHGGEDHGGRGAHNAEKGRV